MPKRTTVTPIPVRRALGLIGRHLADWRRLQRLTAEVVADRAGISVATLQRIEAGSGASLENILRVARSLGVLDVVVQSFDPSETDVGRARAFERLPQRVRPRRGEIP
jgi:transcriptional regulator with XRE-family HTH domain